MEENRNGTEQVQIQVECAGLGLRTPEECAALEAKQTED